MLGPVDTKVNQAKNFSCQQQGKMMDEPSRRHLSFHIVGTITWTFPVISMLLNEPEMKYVVTNAYSKSKTLKL